MEQTVIDKDGITHSVVTYKEYNYINTDYYHIRDIVTDKVAICDLNFNLYCNFDYDDIGGFIEENDCCWVLSGKKYGVLNKKSDLIIPVKYEHISFFGDKKQFLMVGETYSKRGIINLKNEIIIPLIYDSITTYYRDKYFKLLLNDKCGLINDNFEFILPIVYDDISYKSINKILEIKLNNKIGYFDIDNNKFIIEPSLNHILTLSELKLIIDKIKLINERNIKINNLI